MKWNLKPWQIGLIAAAGVVVLGGAGVGIYFGVNHAIDNTVDEKLNAALESMTDTTAEPALDEPSTVIPTQPTTESSTEKERSTVPQTTREPETVLVYVEPTTEDAITWEYDSVLSEEVSKLMNEKFPNAIWDKSINNLAMPGNFVKNNQIVESNDSISFIGKADSAYEIVTEWSQCYIPSGLRFNLSVYRYHGFGEGYVYAALRT